MGRHTAPGTGQPTPDQGFWVRLGVAGVAALLVATWFLTRGDDPVTTGEQSPPRTPAPLATASATPTATTSEAAATSTTASATPSPTATTRPPTLRFVVRRESYITVRVPGGRTLVSKPFRNGAERSFDQKRLQVVNGRPSAVTFFVNGTKRRPGPADEPETFTVRRR